MDRRRTPTDSCQGNLSSAVTTEDDDSRPSSPDSAIWTDMSSPDLSSVRGVEDVRALTPQSASRAQLLRDVFSPPMLPRTPTPNSQRRRRISQGSRPLHRSNPNINAIEPLTPADSGITPSRQRSISTTATSLSQLHRVSSCRQLRRPGTSFSHEVHFQCWLARQPHTWC